jgi:hypothetical protein
VKQPVLKEIKVKHIAASDPSADNAQELLFRRHIKELLAESDLLS